MMHFYARNLAAEGITVNAIAPAIIETDMIEQLDGLTLQQSLLADLENLRKLLKQRYYL